jgi:hypothetical protein
MEPTRKDFVMALVKSLKGASGTTVELATVFRWNSDGSATVISHTFGYGADDGYYMPECKLYRENQVTVSREQALNIAIRLANNGYTHSEDYNL